MITRYIKDRINSHMIDTVPETTRYGEVYTNLYLVEEMLSILPVDYWTNPNLKILDPCNGVGNFPAIMVDKLMSGLQLFEPDPVARYDHIMTNIIHVCEIQESNMNTYSNIFGIKVNKFNGDYLTADIKSVFGVGEFDLIVGNPPYQTGGDSRSSVSIYDKFVSKSVSLSEKVIMITPSKWYSNPSMKSYRNDMLNTYGLKYLVDKGNVFDTVDIKGGVSYFLLDKYHTGGCIYNGVPTNFSSGIVCKGSDDILISKVSGMEKFSSYLYSDQYFGIRNRDDRFLSNPTDNTVKCHVSAHNGSVVYIDRDKLKQKDNTDKYKVFIPTASGSKSSIGELGRIVIGLPGEVCSRSFVHFTFGSMTECESFVSYIATDTVRKLVRLKKQTQLVKKDCFSLVPVVPLDRIWTDDGVKLFLGM